MDDILFTYPILRFGSTYNIINNDITYNFF